MKNNNKKDLIYNLVQIKLLFIEINKNIKIFLNFDKMLYL